MANLSKYPDIWTQRYIDNIFTKCTQVLKVYVFLCEK